jgi:hypothetical protein
VAKVEVEVEVEEGEGYRFEVEKVNEFGQEKTIICSGPRMRPPTSPK